MTLRGRRTSKGTNMKTKTMNLLDLANAGLQTISTAFVAAGGYLIFQESRILEGGILILTGLVCYVLYEKFPTK